MSCRQRRKTIIEAFDSTKTGKVWSSIQGHKRRDMELTEEGHIKEYMEN